MPVLEDLEYQPEDVSEHEQQHGIPYIAEALGVKEDFKIDFKVASKVRAIEEFINAKLDQEHIYRGLLGTHTMLNRMMARSPQAFQNKNKLKMVDLLFSEVALHHEMSSETYLKHAQEAEKYKKVEFLKNELKALLNR